MKWVLKRLWHIGGLTHLGFTADAKYLVVVSHNGRGVFDVEADKKIARDPEPFGPWHRETEVDGIGPCSGVTIKVSGLDLDPKTTAALSDFDLNAHVTEFRAAAMSEDSNFLAVGYSDMVEVYEK